MERVDYQWHLSFSMGESLGYITVPESHPEVESLKWICKLETATLIDMNKFSLLEDDWKQLDAFVKVLNFTDTTFDRSFRRHEVNCTQHISRTVPVLECTSKGEKVYYFTHPDKVVKSKTPRYYREDW